MCSIHGIKQLWEIAFYSGGPIDRYWNLPFALVAHGGLTPDFTISMGHTVSL
jgi:hypothetical protein